MSEEKKKGWFQKFKSAFTGGETVPEKTPGQLDETKGQEGQGQDDVLPKAAENISTTPQETVNTITEEELVKESLQSIEQGQQGQNNVLPKAAEEPPAPPEEAIATRTEEELVQDNLRPSLQQNTTQSAIQKAAEDALRPSQEPKTPSLNVKLEIGKGRVPFSAEEATPTELPPGITPEAPLDAIPGELNVEVVSEEKPVGTLPTELPPGITPEAPLDAIPGESGVEKETEEQSVGSDTDGTVRATPELPSSEEGKKKSWLTKVVNTLNAPIEFKIDTPEGDASFLAKLKGNVSIGLGKPVVERTDEDIARWKESLVEKLSLTRESFTARLTRLMQGRTRIDDELLEEIEEILLESDVGVEMTDAIINKLRFLAKENRFLPSEVMPALFDYLRAQLDAESQRIIIDDTRLNIIMMVGVNGTGKTTTTGKMAAKFRISDYSVILAAADTFRAAAIDQLDVWSQRAEVTLIKHQENSDAAAVVYDAIKAAKARDTNVLLIDTAGRLHNKAHLMDELKKIRRIIDREAPEAKLEVLLVLDGTTGQNGLQQATVFSEAVQLTGVVLTKLDGTAKGGVIFSIKNSLKLPIKLVGVGEGIEDLRDFEPQIFIDALFSEKNESIIEESTKMTSRGGRS